MADSWQQTLPEDLQELIVELYRRKLEKELERTGKPGLLRSTPQSLEQRGKPSKKEREFQEAVEELVRDWEGDAYLERLLLEFTRASQRAIGSVIQELEQDNARFAPGSLSQVVDHTLTLHAARLFPALHVELTGRASEAIVNRRFKDQDHSFESLAARVHKLFG